MIERFGEEVFNEAMQYVVDAHFAGIHTPGHNKSMALPAQSNLFGDVHADIRGFPARLSAVAKEIVGATHPILDNMEKDEFQPPGLSASH